MDMKKLFVAMALLLSGFVGCNTAPEPLKIDNKLTAEEIAAARLTPEVMWKMGRIGGHALSPDGTMAAVTKMGQTDFTFHTELALYSVAENTAPLCCSLGDQLIYDMKFLTEDTLCAIGENRIFLIGSNGVLKEEYKIEDGVLASCCFSENGYAAGIYTLRNGSSRLVTMDGEGAVQTAAVSSEKPLQLRACGRYLSLLDETQVFLYDDTLRLCFLTEHDGWTQVFPWTDGSFFCHADGEVRHIVP